MHYDPHGSCEESDMAIYPNIGTVRAGSLTMNVWYLAHINDIKGEYIRDDRTLRKLNKVEIDKIFPRGVINDWEIDGLSHKKIRKLPYSLTDDEKAIVKAHFLRFMDPLNYFLVPGLSNEINSVTKVKKSIGEYTNLVAFMRDKYKQVYGCKEVDDFYRKALLSEFKVNEDGTTVINVTYGRKIIKNDVKKSHATIMDKNVKNALRDLLLFKVGIKESFENSGILKPINEDNQSELRERLYRQGIEHPPIFFDVINIISQDDINSGYVKEDNTGKIFERKPLEIDNRLLYKDSVINYLTNAVDNFVQFIEDLNDKNKLPLVDKDIPETLSSYDLIKILYKMPILHGIYHSEDKNFVYLKEISVEEIIENSDKYENIYVKKINSDTIERCDIDRVLEMIHRGNIYILKFYIPKTMETLGYADSTFTDNLKWKCNRIYLCQKTIVSEFIQMASNDPWDNNNFWISVLYHELSHVIFGHKGNIPVSDRERDIPVSDRIYKINLKQEHEAQTYSSVLFSDNIASDHIRSYSNNQPVEYQNMPLWGEPPVYCNKTNSRKNAIPPVIKQKNSVCDVNIIKPVQPIIQNSHIIMSVKVGRIVKGILMPLLQSELIDKAETDSLKDRDETHRVFGLTIPLISFTNDGNPKRYYATPIIVNGEEVFVCKEFKDEHKEKLKKWIIDHIKVM